MKQWYLYLCLAGMLFCACQNPSTQNVTDKEKEEIQQLDSLLNDLAKGKKEKLPKENVPESQVLVK